LMKCLRILILLCNSNNLNENLILGLKPEPSERPYIEWIIIVLREALSYIEKMY